ncbi:MAG: HD domain-containing protein [Acidimicrobiales bacterium]
MVNDVRADRNTVGTEIESTEVDAAGREWRARPVLAKAARLTILAVPFIAVTAAAWKLNHLLGEPASVIEAVARWAALSLISTLTLVSIDRAARQYLPLSTLLRLSIVFPDQAPSRFKMALRRGTAKHLAREVAELENASAQEAAEYLLHIVGKLTAHDRLTRGHTERVRAYADLVAVEMGLTEHERMKLQWAGLLHDIGKLTVPADVLNKSTKLSDREWSRL